jgi:hypothetical protein
LLTSDCIHQEAVLEAAGFHVTQSREMRGMVQYRTLEAIESIIPLKRHDTRDRVLVCDYAQNINSLVRFTTFQRLQSTCLALWIFR